MRSYLDVITDLQNGKEVEYEELKSAALAGNCMMKSSNVDVVKLTGYGTDNPKCDLMSSKAIDAYERRLRSGKMPLNEFFEENDLLENRKNEVYKTILSAFFKDKK